MLLMQYVLFTKMDKVILFYNGLVMLVELTYTERVLQQMLQHW